MSATLAGVFPLARDVVPALKHAPMLGGLFVSDEWLKTFRGPYFLLNPAQWADVIRHTRETWVDNHIKGTIGTMYSPCAERPNLVIASYT